MRAERPDSSPSEATSETKPTETTPANERLYTTSSTVLEDKSHGPELCLGGVMESYPPQCGGPAITNWDWSKVAGEESSLGTTWGTYTVVGTYDGTAFALTEPPGKPTRSEFQWPDTSTPCEPPEGGWRPVDPAKTTVEAETAATEYVRNQPDRAGLWPDYSINPGYDRDNPESDGVSSDPKYYVLNVRFTGDLERHEAALRELYGGALCIREVERSEDELREIMIDVTKDIPNAVFAAVEVTTNGVSVRVTVDDGVQERLDEKYGKGVIQVNAALTPVE